MVQLHKILSDLRDELSLGIRKINPNRAVDPSCGFTEFKPDADTRVFLEYAAPNRMFEISEPVFMPDVQMGKTTTHPEIEITITIAYPDTTKWAHAAADDFKSIEYYLNTHPSAVAGVAARWVRSPATVQHVFNADHSRRFWSLVVFAQLEVTH